MRVSNWYDLSKSFVRRKDDKKPRAAPEIEALGR